MLCPNRKSTLTIVVVLDVDQRNRLGQPLTDRPTDRRSRSTLIETGKGFLRSREELSAYRLRELRAELTQSGLCTYATPSLTHGIHESLNYHPQFLTPAIPFACSPLFRSKAYLTLAFRLKRWQNSTKTSQATSNFMCHKKKGKLMRSSHDWKKYIITLWE